MVKKEIKYSCEICGDKYNEEKEALKCEKRGVPELLTIGFVFAIYEDRQITFCIAEQEERAYGHHHRYSCWATRERSLGEQLDTLGHNFCGYDSWDLKFPPDKNLPSFKRMIDWLKLNNIEPIIYGD